MVKVGIINVTGYAGAELARLLYNHPEADVASVTGRSEAGKKLADVFPHLASYDLTIEPELSGSVDFAFSALPHAASAEACAPLVRAGLPVVDISADFRLHDAAVYSEWYGGEHPAQELLPDAAYGLPELHREAIKAAKLVANPGCYPESAILALARVSAYGLDGHRHWPEIDQELSAIWPEGASPKITFTPHLIPMTRGILTTAYAPLVPGAVPDGDAARPAVREIYEQFYENEPFVRVAASPPATKQTRGSNMCLVYPTVDVRTGRLVVVSVLDNLVKGAAGQAIQNMNLMLGMPETTALDMPAVYP